MRAFTVDMVPRGWARARTGNGHYFVDAKTKAAKDRIAHAYRAQAGRHPILDGPVEVSIQAIFPPLKKMPTWQRKLLGGETFVPKHTKPDVDNIAKLVMDALNGVAWVDDAQVCRLVIRKSYDHTPGFRVAIREIPLPQKEE